jgi:AcrR family transcriptional regulator
MTGTAQSGREHKPNRRGRPTAENSRLKTAHLMEVARDLFAFQGYRAVTMRKVAEMAGVSTRTLYDRFADKLSLFQASLDFGSMEFPRIAYDPAVPPDVALREFAALLVRMLSTDSSLRMSRVVTREGNEFPELIDSANAVQHKYLLVPLSAYMCEVGLAQDGSDGEPLAKLFIALALADWQRRFSFLQPLPTGAEVERHAQLATQLFLKGAQNI